MRLSSLPESKRAAIEREFYDFARQQESALTTI